MSNWSDGYFTQSTYTYGYYRELSPTYQRFCLLARGFAAPEPSEDDIHCELGYGQGVSVNIHAAATPGKFIGTDFNPAHAANANELLKASTADAKFFDDSFEQLTEKNLPQFDSISLHGIWSWISSENQKIIVEFARKNLKPGGIFYNSYNCFPGWAAKSPMRELFILYDKYAHNSSNTYKRIEEALNFTDELFKANPAYAMIVPEVKTAFEQTRKLDHDYLAHEYFNRDWICMYFTEVAEMLDAAKLEFACSAVLLDFFDGLNFPQPAREFLDKIENPVMREQARDYFVNQQFRKDLYIRGARHLNPFDRLQRLMNTKYVLLTAGEISLKLRTNLGEANLSREIYDPLIEYLREDNFAPKDLNKFVATHPEIPVNAIEQAIIILVHANAAAPCQSDSAIALVKNRCDKLNDYFYSRARFSGDINFLASPVTGAGVPVDRIAQLLIPAWKSGNKDAKKLSQELWKIFDAQGQRLIMSGKTLETPEENLNEFEKIAKNFLEKILPIFKVLQII